MEHNRKNGLESLAARNPETAAFLAAVDKVEIRPAKRRVIARRDFLLGGAFTILGILAAPWANHLLPQIFPTDAGAELDLPSEFYSPFHDPGLLEAEKSDRVLSGLIWNDLTWEKMSL